MHSIAVTVTSASGKMNLAILIAVAVLGGSAAEECSGFYRVPSTAGQVLKDGVMIPYQLALDRDTNTLFFSYTPNDADMFQSMYIDLKRDTAGDVRGVANGFAHAYDSQHQIVYIGGRDGIYEFDYKTKTATNLNITRSNIWQLFYKNGLYFTTYPDEKTFIYKDGKVERLAALQNNNAMLVAVDKDQSIVFVHDGELKRVRDGKVVDLGDYSVNCFNTDADDNLYFSTADAVYRVFGDVVKKVASFENIYGFVIEGENQLIYGADSNVVRVTLTSDMCGDDKQIENETSNNV